MINEYDICIEKINDKIQPFIPMKVPVNYTIMDVKYDLLKYFGLKIAHQFLLFNDKNLNDSDKLTTIFDKQNSNRNIISKFEIKLLYNYNSEDELINNAKNHSSNERHVKKNEFNIKTHFINNEKKEDNYINQNSYGYNTQTFSVSNKNNNFDNQQSLVQKKRPREESSKIDLKNSFKKLNSGQDFNPWNNKKKSNKGMFCNNYKIYDEDHLFDGYADEEMKIEEGPNDFDKLKNLLDFDKEFFKLPEKTFDEAKLSVSMKKKEDNMTRAHKDTTTKNVYELCSKFFNESMSGIPTIIVELPTKRRTKNISEKDEIFEIKSILDENDDYINNVEDLISRLSESQIKKDINNDSKNEIADDQYMEYYDEIEEFEEIKEDDEDLDGMITNNDNNQALNIQNNFVSDYIIQEVIEKEAKDPELDEDIVSNDSIGLLSGNQEFSLSTDQLKKKTIKSLNPLIPAEISIIIEEPNIGNNILRKTDEMIIKEKNQFTNNTKYTLSSSSVPVSEFTNKDVREFQSVYNFKSHTREEIKIQFESLYRSRKESRDIVNLIKNLEHFNEIIDEVNLDSSFIMMNPKLNIVLDLDSTLIYCSSNNLRYDEVSDDLDVFQEELTLNGNTYYLTLKIRPYVKEFLGRIKNYSNFYINTHGVSVYGKRVAEKLEEVCNIKIPLENIRGREYDYKSLSQFNKTYEFLEKSIIIDDTISVWNPDNISRHVLVNSMRYVSFFPNKNLSSKDLPKISLNGYELNLTDIKMEKSSRLKIAQTSMLRDDNYTPLWSEYNYSTKYQMKYLGEFIEKVYKIVTITDCILYN